MSRLPFFAQEVLTFKTLAVGQPKKRFCLIFVDLILIDHKTFDNKPFGHENFDLTIFDHETFDLITFDLKTFDPKETTLFLFFRS